MMDHAEAVHFAKEWIAAWNAHDLERILSHYAEDFEMKSPLIRSRMGVESGVLRSKESIRAYWAKALAAEPPLHFVLLAVMTTVDGIVILYESRGRNPSVAEVLTFGEDGKVIRGAAYYSSTAAPT